MPQDEPGGFPVSAAAILDDIPVPIIVYRLDGVVAAMNSAAEAFWGRRRADMVGVFNLFDDATAQTVNIAATFGRVRAGDVVMREPTRDYVMGDGGATRQIWYQATIFPVRDAGRDIRFAGYIYHDVTEQVEQQEQLARTQQEVVAQQHLIQELAIPVVQLWEGILLAPLVGAIDSRRAVIVVEQLLEAIVQRSADVVILDITGVPIIDTAVANYLVNTARAVRLLGADIALTGMRGEIAIAVVHLGIDLGEFVTHANLQAGLAWAFERRGLTVARRG